MDKNKLEAMLNIAPADDAKNNAVVVYNEKKQKDVILIDRDFEYTRENLMGLIESGSLALEDLIVIAQQSQHPRAFEVVAGLMKTLLDANKSLMDVHKQKQDLQKDEEAPKNTESTVNNLFVGSTAELQQFLKTKNENNE